MKLFFLLLFLGMYCNSLQSQNWFTVQQNSLGIAYSLPNTWYIGGHNNQCHCKGMTVNSAPDGTLSMLVVIGNTGQKDLLQQPLLGYNFVPVENVDTRIPLENLTFEKSTSTWKQSHQEVVVCFIGHETENKLTYILYFWGDAQTIDAQNNVIDTIVRSFKTL